MLSIALYLMILCVIVIPARRARQSLAPSDHFLAARSLGPVVLFFTLYATMNSGNTLLGYPGAAYRMGYAWILATGFMMAIPVALHCLVPKLRPLAITHGFVTPGDFIRQRFPEAKNLRRLLALCMIFALANFLFASLKAMGEVTEIITDGAIPYAAGVFGLAIFVVVYESLGGMRAVAWTDAVQGFLMLLGLCLMLHWVLNAGGGLQQLNLTLADIRPEALLVQDSASLWYWLSTLLMMAFASTMYPQTIQRIYAAKSAQSLKFSFAMISFMPLITTLVITLVGIAAIVYFPGLDRLASDQVLMQVLALWSQAGWLQTLCAMMVLVAALAAIMSTTDSVLLSLGSVITSDLLDKPTNQISTTLFAKRMMVVLALGMAALAMLRDITLWRLIEIKMEVLIQCVPAFLFGLHVNKVKSNHVLAGLMFGLGIVMVTQLLGVKTVAGWQVAVLAVIANSLLVFCLTFGRTKIKHQTNTN